MNVSVCIATILVVLGANAAARAASTEPAAAKRTAPTPPKPLHIVELSVAGIYEKMTTSEGNTSGALSKRSGGNAVGIAITYRTPYFISPFLDISYYPLYRSDRYADLGSAGGRAFAVGSLSAFGFMGGGALDIWRLRVRAGVGTYAVTVRSAVGGTSINATESDMGYLVAAEATLIQSHRFKLGVEARGAFIIEASTTALGIGLTMHGDLFRW